MWSQVVPVKLPEIGSGKIILKNILSISVLEWLLSRVGCKICGMKEFDVRASRNSLAGLWLL